MSVNFNPSGNGNMNVPVCRAGKTPFEVNSDAYGPVAASVIGVAEAAANAASATVSFSDQALHRLSGSVQDAIGSVEDGCHRVESAVESVVDGVTDAADAAASRVGNAVSSAYGAVGDAAGQAAAYATLGVQALRALV